MASEIDLFRQENAKYDEARDEITKLRPELKNRI